MCVGESSRVPRVSNIRVGSARKACIRNRLVVVVVVVVAVVRSQEDTVQVE